MAVKFMVTGYEASGKTSLISQIEKALIINCDSKPFHFAIANASYKHYKGAEDFCNFVSSKIAAYNEAYGEFPKYLVIDTLTQLYAAMAGYNSNTYKNYDIHTQNTKDVHTINMYLQDFVLANGVGVIATAHTIHDEATNRHIIPSQGAFSRAGGWYSLVNESIFIEKSSGKLVVYNRSMKYPARTLIPEFPDKLPIEDFDINKHLEILESKADEAVKYEL